MGSELWKSLKAAATTLVVCVVIYPAAILAAAIIIAPEARLGSLLADQNGQIVGSGLIAQGFSRPEYFWPRPSAVEYDSSAAGGSNLSPANPAIRQRAENIIASLKLAEGEPVAADFVTASGSGLDPHISLRAATGQVPRIAVVRSISEKEIVRLIEIKAIAIPLTTQQEKLVNVLELNLALDALAASESGHE